MADHLLGNLSTTNTTYTAPNNISEADGPVWSFSTYFTLSIEIAAFLTNCALANLFVRDKSLITPFTIYAINLTIGNVLSSMIFDSIEVFNSRFSKWLLGDAMCTFYEFSDWMFAGSICNAHALIALNRFWAVTFPNSYRQLHSIKLASFICVGMWVYMHICILPGILLDTLIYRQPIEVAGCNTNAVKAWQISAQLLIFDVPLIIIVGVFPVVCYKALNRVRRPVIQPGSQNSTKAVSLPFASQPSVPTSSKPVAPVSGNVGTYRPASGRQTAREKTSRGLLALTIMTITVLVCYTPANISNTLWVFGMNIEGLYSVVSVIYAFTPVMDPVWFIITLPDLRRAFLRVYFKRPL